MESDGSNQIRISNNVQQNEEPSWSSDGTKIIWSRADYLWVMNSDGTNPQDLFQQGDQPAWSPDGTKIVFRSLRSNSYLSIWVMNADGSGAQQIHPDGAYPCWSPDGKILFSDWRDGALRMMDADGTNISVLKDGSYRQPHWGPAAP